MFNSSLHTLITNFLKKHENAIETFRRILRLCFLLYYVLVIPYRICFLSETLRIDGQFLLFNIFDYVVVDLFFFTDTLEILKTRWKRIKRWVTAVLPITESDNKGPKYLLKLNFSLDFCHSHFFYF